MLSNRTGKRKLERIRITNDLHLFHLSALFHYRRIYHFSNKKFFRIFGAFRANIECLKMQDVCIKASLREGVCLSRGTRRMRCLSISDVLISFSCAVPFDADNRGGTSTNRLRDTSSAPSLRGLSPFPHWGRLTVMFALSIEVKLICHAK